MSGRLATGSRECHGGREAFPTPDAYLNNPSAPIPLRICPVNTAVKLPH